ncbi:MAG: hypothetical protein OET21_03965, partial [Desulfobacterales bacterium]|nr:hypothetical protein [Desulfobacterales bacterium]
MKINEKKWILKERRDIPMLQVNPVNNRHEQRLFIRLPWSIYADDPEWIPPLILERKEHLSPRNPYFEHARYQSWIAYRDGNPVGRISAQIDQLHLDRCSEKEGFFGMIEAEDNAETFSALFQTAES